jgi:hypothetical protein
LNYTSIPKGWIPKEEDQNETKPEKKIPEYVYDLENSFFLERSSSLNLQGELNRKVNVTVCVVFLLTFF